MCGIIAQEAKGELTMAEEAITWAQRRGQIKHFLYELCLYGRIDRKLLYEQFNDLNNVEPVVRCKDCKWRSPYVKGHCDNPDIGLGTDDDDFCSMAERRQGG